ncbi:hypothetical protein STEG23_029638, partial [Scotinomys teguina]
MQREDIILEWIFLPNKQSKKLKTYVEKISDLILKGKLRLRQLAGIDPAEIVVPLTKEEIEKLWAESEPWQRACSNFLGEINSKYPKSDRIELIKRADWILPRIVRETPISGVRTFYTDANKQGKAGYKSEDLSKVVQSPYNSVQKSELYAILLVLMDFSEPLNIVTDSQYAERVVLHIETAEFIPDESELTSLFIQLQDIIRNRKHPLYITHIRSHTGLPGPLAQGNDEIDKLLIGNVLEASEFHKKHHVNSKGLKRDFSITWQQAKEIVRKCPTCSFYNQTPLPAGCNPKGTQRNDIWQMDVFHFAEFGKLKYVHHTIDTYSGFQWATALSSEKADSVITHLLEVMAIMGIPAQIKTDNAPAYVSGKMKQFFAYYNIKHITEAQYRFSKAKNLHQLLYSLEYIGLGIASCDTEIHVDIQQLYRCFGHALWNRKEQASLGHISTKHGMSSFNKTRPSPSIQTGQDGLTIDQNRHYLDTNPTQLLPECFEMSYVL